MLLITISSRLLPIAGIVCTTSKKTGKGWSFSLHYPVNNNFALAAPVLATRQFLGTGRRPKPRTTCEASSQGLLASAPGLSDIRHCPYIICDDPQEPLPSTPSSSWRAGVATTDHGSSSGGLQLYSFC